MDATCFSKLILSSMVTPILRAFACPVSKYKIQCNEGELMA